MMRSNGDAAHSELERGAERSELERAQRGMERGAATKEAWCGMGCATRKTATASTRCKAARGQSNGEIFLREKQNTQSK